MQTGEMRNRYRLQQWTEIIRECRSSGQTVVRWCADHEVNVKSYYYWLRKIREAACESLPALSSSNQPTLVPVPSSLRRNSPRPEASQEQAAIILRTDAVTIEIHPHASTALLEQTLRILQYVR
ncbi:IS66 family insertion sequence element accessory protein TnpA [Paenibacillus periandrae]|uniref:IS66 family insertion sequence element accessory protein TnpA n=1 Tax=Paenibacillus periandrae TaxID=1761741 RepID=UPI001F0891E4|nr:transposase [Paenibacillus periandrae]